MSVKFFGQFLLEKNIISPKHLLEVVKYQDSVNMKFGDYAVSKGYLSKEDARRVSAAQQSADLLFGEMAVKMGVLVEAQIKEVLLKQKNDHVYIGAALVRKGYIGKETLVKELTLFRKDQAAYNGSDLALPEQTEDAELIQDMLGVTRTMLVRVASITAKTGEAFISSKEPERNFSTIKMPMTGDVNYDYILSSSLEASESIAGSMLNVNVINESSEMIADCVKEFVNIICGNIMAKMAQRGKKVNIEPPFEADFTADGGFSLVKGRRALYFPFISTAGDMTLILVKTGQDPD